MKTITTGKNINTSKWLKRIGVGAFLFFLIKGLIWIGVFIYLTYLI